MKDITKMQVGDIYLCKSNYGDSVFKVIQIDETDDFYEVYIKDFELEDYETLSFRKDSQNIMMNALNEDYLLLIEGKGRVSIKSKT